MSGIDLTLENIKGQINDLRQQFTLARKKGLDVTIPHLRFLGIPAKIGVVQATQSYEDLKKLVAQIDEVKIELAEIEGVAPPRAPPSMNHDDSHSRIAALLLDIEQAEASNDKARMTKAYTEIRGLYPSAPEDLKKEMYKKTLELYEKLKGVK